MKKPSAPRPRLAARHQWFFVLFPLAALAGVGCYREPTRWDEVQEKTRRITPAVSKEAVAGGEFNKMFPKASGDYAIIYTQEKPGFAQADLNRQGSTVATLSIFDTVSNPEAAQDYRDATTQLGGYPLIDIGSKGTGVLVGNRFQVQVRSKDANFSKNDREDWLKKFDLANLESLARLQ
ncbi:MAG: hypothetical protein JO116_26495 [Planctomycetaceae bacterium]|nr:hypothetical protein [Planctomycetaceae bacterium]MBV8605834.1 hypothetical protein [Singulisphaera sp.]